MKDTALLIIDIQNDYFPGGKMELEGADAAAIRAAGALQLFRDKGLPVFHIQHESVKPGAVFFLPGTNGREISGYVTPIPGETCITKHFPNSFKDTGLEEMLREKSIRHLVITGMMTFMCVDATARAAKDLGFSCTLVHDATAGRALEFNGRKAGAESVQTAFLGALSMVCDRVIRLDDLLGEFYV